MEKLSCILSIAGSDSGGGAGIQADLKTVSMLGGYGASVITALTAQNTTAVTGIHAPSPKFVAQQLKTVLDDICIDAAKTGMLYSEQIIQAIVPFLQDKKFPLVVDPVCIATSGARLLKDDAVEAMVKGMFPCADLLTPNIPEAELFAGVKIHDRDDIFRAAQILLDMGPGAILIKGGHSDSWAITDWFIAQDADPVPFMQPRVKTTCTHGTGCTLSAAIATGLGQGLEMGAAIKRAQDYLNLALRAGYAIGAGGGPPNHLVPWLKNRNKDAVLSSINDLARCVVTKKEVLKFIPMSRSNVAVSLPFSESLHDIAGLTGGILSNERGEAFQVGYPEFGASQNVGAVLLAAQRVNSNLNCCISLNGSSRLKRAFDAIGIVSVWMCRDKKPEYILDLGGRFEGWGTFECLKEHTASSSVNAVGDPGDFGREPILYLLAKDASTLKIYLEQLEEILTNFSDE